MEVVFLTEVQKREAVGKDQQIAHGVRAQGAEVRVESFKLRAVVLAVRAVEIGVFRVRRAERVGDGAAEP